MNKKDISPFTVNGKLKTNFQIERELQQKLEANRIKNRKKKTRK